MLSSKGIKAGDAGAVADYYDRLAAEDYYTNGGEPLGKWIGRGAERMSLDGEVKEGELRAAFHGYHPRTGEAIAARLGDDHKPGEDLCFSAPKSVSMVWAAGDDATRKAISEAQQRAVEAAIKHAEQSGAFRTQHGHAGVEKQAYTGGLAVATFEHSTSREGDPQLHTHAIAMNLSDTGRNIDFDAKQKMLLGAAYRAELASEMQKLGFEIERDKTSFRIAGVSKDLEKDFSKRRQQIEKELRKLGMSGGKAASVATLSTREAKGEVDRAALFEKAKAVASGYGLDADKIKAMREPSPDRDREQLQMPSHAEMASQLTERASTLTPQQLEAACYQQAQGVASLEEAKNYIEKLKNSAEIIELRDNDGNTRYTSREMYEIESNLSARAAEMATDKSHGLRAETLAAALEAKAQASMARTLANPKLDAADRELIKEARRMSPEARAAWRETLTADQQKVLSDVQGLSDEQRKAFESLTSEGRLRVLEGTAGTGKSYLLDACRDAWQREGYEVTGCALAAKAARGLKKSSSIESRTVHSMLARLDSGKMVLTNKSVVVMDEAGMTGSRLMARMQEHVDRAGAKLVIVGDTKQLQPVDNGGAMRAQREALEKAGVPIAELNEIRRQSKAEERAMVLDAKAGRGEAVVDYLQSKERIIVHETRDDLLKALAAKTISDSQLLNEKNEKMSALAMAETNAETRQVNLYAREIAKEQGLVDKVDSTFSAERGEREFSAGDRIYCLKNDAELGVDNGTLGTVTKAEDGKLTIKIDGEDKTIELTQDRYNHVDHGYCATVHKSQGDTVDYATYAPGSMADRELSYVALSRHREEVEVHVTKDQLADLGKRFSRSNQKDTSADYTKVEKHQNDIDKAEKHITAARERIAELEAKRAALTSPAADKQVSHPNQTPTTSKENHDARPDRYAERPAQRYEPLSGRTTDAAYQAPAGALPAKSLDELRNLSASQVLSDARRLDQVPLQRDERDHLGNRREESDYGVRRAGDRTAHAAGGERERVATPKQLASRQKRLASLDAKLAEAKKDLASATKTRDAAQAKQQQAKEQAAAPVERPKAEPVRMSVATREANAQRDANLAKRALEAHQRGDKLPRGRELDKAIKSGEIKPTKDSAGRTYFENKKTGTVHSKALSQAPKRETTSKNLNHLGLTSTKYKVIDKKLLGITVGSTVLKSGGTLRKEAAGALRDKLHAATQGRDTAKVLAKPLDRALQKAEGWQKAGAIESAVARIQMKIEQKAAERAAVRDLQNVVKAAEKPKAIEKPAEKAPEKGPANDRGDDIAKRAERLAARQAPERAPEKPGPEKGGYER